MDAENALHMFNKLTPTALECGEADWLTHILDRLDQEQPETYAAELPYLLSYHLHAAAAGGHLYERGAEHVDHLTTMAAQNIDEVYPCIDLIAYHGSLTPIAEAMDDGSADVRKSSDVMPFAKSELGNTAVQYAILAFYEQHGDVDLQDPDLQAQIDRIDDPVWGEVDTDFVERFATRPSSPNDQPWQVGEDLVDNIHWLTIDFVCAAYEETDIPLGRAHFAREGIGSC